MLKARHEASGQVRAIKRVFVRRQSSDQREQLSREQHALQALHHPNVVRLLEQHDWVG